MMLTCEPFKSDHDEANGNGGAEGSSVHSKCYVICCIRMRQWSVLIIYVYTYDK